MKFTGLVLLAQIISAAQLFSNEGKQCCKPEGSAILFADFLWWQTQNQGFSFAFNQTANNDALPNIGKVVRIDPKWDPGFRVGAGWYFDRKGWYTVAKWTWYENSSERTKNLKNLPVDNAGQGLYTLWPTSQTIKAGSDLGPYAHVRGTTTLHYNNIDLTCGKEWCLSSHVLAKPEFGICAAWLHQKFHSHLNSSVISRQAGSITFHGKNNYWGAGLTAGSAVEWDIIRGFGLFGDANIALLYGRTTAKNLSKGPSPTSPVVAIHHLITDHFDQLVPHLQMIAGLEWKSCFSSGSLVTIKACWEVNYWWNQFNVPISFEGFAAPMPSVGNQPLTLQGITIDLGYHY